MNTFKLVASATAIATLAACGGGSTSGGGSSFASISNEAERLFNEFEDIEATPVADVPDSGSAGYSGIMGATASVAGEESDIAGLVDLDVNFGSDSFDGRIYDLVDEFEDTVAGTVRIQNGTFDRTGGSEVLLEADASGTLTNAEGQTIGVDGGVLLGFGGADAEVLAGLIGGDLDVDGTSGSFLGAIVTEAD